MISSLISFNHAFGNNGTFKLFLTFPFKYLYINVVRSLIVVGLLRIPRLYVWYPRKLPLLAISRFCVMQGFEIVVLIFFCTRMQYEYFLRYECASMFLIFVRKYRKYTNNRGRMLYIVCASALISPLRQQLDSCANSLEKMCDTLKHFIHIQLF